MGLSGVVLVRRGPCQLGWETKAGAGLSPAGRRPASTLPQPCLNPAGRRPATQLDAQGCMAVASALKDRDSALVPLDRNDVSRDSAAGKKLRAMPSNHALV